MAVIVINRQNNFGDAMCQMRAIKEYKERTGLEFDFVSCHYLHYLAAKHTDNFRNVYYKNSDECNAIANDVNGHGYDSKIEFTVDWGMCCERGMTQAWTQCTLGFDISDERPYFLITEDERITAQCQYGMIMNHHPHFRKSIILNLESVSSSARGFRQEDWERVIDLIPQDVAIFYPVPITWTFGNPLRPRPNLFVLPGYPVGETAALSQLVDVVLVVHSGPLMLAYAVDAKHIVHICFLENGSQSLVHIPADQCENWYPQNNRDLDWNGLADLINRHLNV